MRTAEERLVLLHERADILKKRKEKTSMFISGITSGCLLACLLVILAISGNIRHKIAETGYAATSLLSENAGGYVLAGVIAFSLGVIVTLLLIKSRKNKTSSAR